MGSLTLNEESGNMPSTASAVRFIPPTARVPFRLVVALSHCRSVKWPRDFMRRRMPL
jgi:hypothetical protein